MGLIFRSDFGFDPAGLGKDAKSLARFREAEIMNGRWAMMGAVSFGTRF